MGPPNRSRKFVLLLLLYGLFGSMTVLFGAGDTVKITSPAHRAKVSGTIEIMAQVSLPESVSYVMLVVDDTRPASKNADPWTFELDTRDLSDGPHHVSVEAYDRQGVIAASKTITLIVKNKAARPVATVISSTPSQHLTTASTVKKPLATVLAPRTPQRTAAQATVSPKVIASIAPMVGAVSVSSSTVTSSGPTPEPTRTVAVPTIAPRDAAAPLAQTTTVALAAPRVTTPPSVKSAPPALLSTVPQVVLNGSPLNAGVASVLRNGRLHTGFRALFASTGARIEWHADTRTARCVSDSLTIDVPIGSRIATVNGRPVDMGSVATVVDGRTVVPLLFFANATGARLSWDARTSIARVEMPTYALASVSASLPSTANLPLATPALDGMRSPISEVAERAP